MMNLIEDYIKFDSCEYNFCYYNSREPLPTDIKNALFFLRAKANFIYSDDLCRRNPFGQLYDFCGEESIKIENLSATDAEQLLEILELTKHPFLIAKIYDIACIVTKNKDYGVKAAENYENFLVEGINTCKHTHSLYVATIRALFLYHEFQKVNEKKLAIDIFTTLQCCDSARHLVLKYYTISTIETMNDSDTLKIIVPYIDKIVHNYDKQNVILYLELLKIAINHYKSTHNQKKYISALDLYISYSEKASEEFPNQGLKYLGNALKLISNDTKLRDLYEEKINELLFKKDELEQNRFDSMKMHEIELAPELNKQLMAKQKECENYIKSFQNGMQQLLLVPIYFKPITSSELNQHLLTEKNSLAYKMTNIVFDKNKRIIYDSSQGSEKEKLEYETAQSLSLDLDIKYGIFLHPFIFNLSVDNELKTGISEIIEKNAFVPAKRQETVISILMEGFNRNIRKAVYDLISQFENGIKLYLKTQKIYPQKWNGHKYIDVDINHILTSRDGNNLFRNALEKVIESDLLLELEYLLCSKFSGNLRNKNYHEGYDNPEQYSIYEAATFYFLLEAYFMGYE